MTILLIAVIYLAFISLGLPDSLLGSAWPSMFAEIGSTITGAGTLANGTLSLSGAADISAMSYRLADGVLPAASASVVVLEATGGVTGQFASVSLPSGYRLTYSGNQVRLAKGGMMVLIR